MVNVTIQRVESMRPRICDGIAAKAKDMMGGVGMARTCETTHAGTVGTVLD